MRTRTFITMIFAPSLAMGAVINPQGIAAVPSDNKPLPSVFPLDLFKGNISGPCQDPSIEISLDSTSVLNSTVNYCISTQGIPATCIRRRMSEQPGVEVAAQTYEATHGGLDTKAHQCTIFGYQKDGCPRDEGTAAQYHPIDATWSWDHQTRIRDDFPGRLWSVLSFRMSCTA